MFKSAPRGSLLTSAVLCCLVAGCPEKPERPTCTITASCVGGDGGPDDDAGPDLCSDLDDDGHSALGCPGGDDCDDGDEMVSPSQDEVCDNRDNDCDDEVDEDLLVEGTDVVLPPISGRIEQLALAANATGYGLLRSEADEAGGTSLYFQALRPNGEPTDPVQLEASPVVMPYGRVAVTATPQGFLAAWPQGQESQILAAAIEGTEVIDIGPFESAPRSDTPAMASGASTALIIWSDMSIIEFALVETDGQGYDVISNGFVTDHGSRTLLPAVVWTTDHYVVAGPDAQGLRTFTVSEDGVVGQGPLVATGEALAPALSWNGFEGAAAYYTLSLQGMWVIPIDESGATIGSDVAIGEPGSRWLHLAGAARAHAFAWLVGSGAFTYTGVLQFSLLGPTGLPTNDISPDDSAAGNAGHVNVAPTAGGYVLVWIGEDGSEVRFDRIVCRE